MGFVDTVMVGRVSPRDLAAVALGNSLWVPVFLLMTGVLLATTPKVAQRFGAGNHSEIGPLVRQALWLALAVGLLCAVALWNAEPVLHWMQVDDSLIEPAMGYLRAVACGFPAVALYHVLRCFSDGLGHTRPTMVLGLLGLLNIPLNYIFIYGKLGLPAMGGVGCGWATALVMVAMLLGMLIWVAWAPYYQASGLLRRFDWPQGSVIRRLLSVGLPIGVSIFAEASIFLGDCPADRRHGRHRSGGPSDCAELQLHGVHDPLLIGHGRHRSKGQALGRREPREARFAAGVAMATALAYACLSASGMLWLRTDIAEIYTPDLAVIGVAGSLLIYSAFFQFSDAIQVTAAGALRGYQDTRVTMLITLLAYWGIGSPVGYSLGLSDWLGEPSGPKGLWQGLVVGLTCAALLLGIRLARSARRHIRAAGAQS